MMKNKAQSPLNDQYNKKLFRTFFDTDYTNLCRTVTGNRR